MRVPGSVLITFGDGDLRYKRAARRLCKEAKSLGIYRHAIPLDLAWLRNADPEVYAFVRRCLDQGVRRGVGFWLWKYSAILWASREFPGYLVHYLDAGHSVTSDWRARSWIGTALREASDSGAAATRLADNLEFQWTKREVFDRLDPARIFSATNQIDASTVILGGAFTKQVAEEIRALGLEKSGILINDDLWLPQGPGFIEHRHDQSLLSLYWKSRGLPETSSSDIIRQAFLHDRRISGFSGRTPNVLRPLVEVEFYAGKAEKALRNVARSITQRGGE